MYKGLIYILLVFCLPKKVLCQKETKTGLARRYYHKGEFAYGAGKVEEAFAYFDSSFASGNKYAVDYYNVACVASLCNKFDLAFNYLDLAINFGFLDSAWCKKDSDFDNLRQDGLKWSILIHKINKKLNALSDQVKTIKNHENIFPFMKNNFWGFFDIASGEVIIEPLFEYCAVVLNGLHIKTILGHDLYFNKNGELINCSDFNNAHPYYLGDRYPRKNLNKIQVGSNNDFNGFRFNAEQDTILFSDIFSGFKPEDFNIDYPFKINENYYLPVHKNTKWGIIDSSGKPLNNFDFSYDDLIFNSIHKKTNWFYYQKGEERGFINEKGKKWNKENLLSYPYYGNDIACVNLQSKNINGINYSGLLDYKNLCWLFKPTSVERIIQKTKFDSIKIVGQAIRITKNGIFKNKFMKKGFLIIKIADRAGYIDSNFIILQNEFLHWCNQLKSCFD